MAAWNTEHFPIAQGRTHVPAEMAHRFRPLSSARPRDDQAVAPGAAAWLVYDALTQVFGLCVLDPVNAAAFPDLSHLVWTLSKVPKTIGIATPYVVTPRGEYALIYPGGATGSPVPVAEARWTAVEHRCVLGVTIQLLREGFSARALLESGAVRVHLRPHETPYFVLWSLDGTEPRLDGERGLAAEVAFCTLLAKRTLAASNLNGLIEALRDVYVPLLDAECAGANPNRQTPCRGAY